MLCLTQISPSPVQIGLVEVTVDIEHCVEGFLVDRAQTQLSNTVERARATLDATVKAKEGSPVSN